MGKNITISSVAVDENSNLLDNVNVNVVISGSSYNVTTDSVGFWSLNYIRSVARSLTVSVIWIGDSNYLSFINFRTFILVEEKILLNNTNDTPIIDLDPPKSNLVFNIKLTRKDLEQ